MGKTPYATLKKQKEAAEARLGPHKIATVNFKSVDNAQEYHQKLIEKLHDRDHFEQHMADAYLDNAPLTAMLEKLTENTTDPRQNARKRGRDEDMAEMQYHLKRFSGTNMIMGMLTRLRSKDNAPFGLTVLSIIAYRTGVPRLYWRILNQARVIENCEWTESLVLGRTCGGIVDRHEW